MVPAPFITPRLMVRDARPSLGDMAARRSLEAALADLLTPGVLEHLPPPLQLEPGTRIGSDIGCVTTWIDARAAESDVLLVDRRGDGALVGLMFVADGSGGADRPNCHIGYLLAETVWGQGLASELLIGFVASMATREPVRLIGGVDRANPASARVMEKAGFAIVPELSSPQTAIFARDVG